MRIGLTGLAGSGKSTVFSALTGIDAAAGHRRGREGASIGTVKVPDPRVDALALIYRPRKVVYAELSFTDLGGGRASGLERGILHAMRDMDALCHVLRAFPGAAGDAPDPSGELETLETEALLADLEVVEQRVERLRKEGKKTPELALLNRVRDALEGETALRGIDIDAIERKALSGFGLLTLKPLLVVYNVAEEDIGRPPPPALLAEAAARGAGVVTLSAQVETDIAQMEGARATGVRRVPRSRRAGPGPLHPRRLRPHRHGVDDHRRPGRVPGLAHPAGPRCPRRTPRAKIHSDIERGFIRAEVVPWRELVERGSEAKCREAGVLRVEGKDYIVRDGDVVRFRFNV